MNRLVLLVIPALACDIGSLDTRRDRLESEMTRQEHVTDYLGMRVDRLDMRVENLVGVRAELLMERYATTDTLYQGLQSRLDAVATQLIGIAETYDTFTDVMIVAALVGVAGNVICATKMSTTQFRRWEAVTAEKDIHHAFPRSRGGIDHPLNYAPLNAHVNRQIGNGVLESAVTVPVTFVTGTAATILGGLAGCL